MATKRLSIALLVLLLVQSAFAANKDLEKDITMVSYEQSWLDRKGTLALKNNTNEEVKNLVFLITYLDMSGNELDYEEFSKRVSIAPRMTRKLDIPAYEHDRWYHYYKSEGTDIKANTSFKIKFQLKDYNIEPEALAETDEYSSFEYDYSHANSSAGGLYVIIGIIGILFAIGITIGLYVLVAVMAQKRNRNVVTWILLSLLATPLLMVIILLCIGKDESNRALD